MPRGRPRSFEPEAAVDRAMLAFWTKGYWAISFNDLEGIVGASKPTIYAAFGSKDALFARALQLYKSRFVDPELEALESAASVYEGLCVWFRAGMERYLGAQGPLGCLIVRTAFEHLEIGGAVDQTLHQTMEDARRRIEARLKRARDNGEVTTAADDKQMAVYLLTVRNGMAVSATAGAGRPVLETCVSMALKGLEFAT